MLVSSCKKGSWLNRKYHDITAKYNGFFNANIKFSETVDELEKQQKDDFTKVLPVFMYGDKQTAKGKAGTFDEVIKKASAVITNHEVSKYVDDAFFLIGKSYFYKTEYFEAIETFQYVYSKYKSEQVAKESMIWLVKAYIETDQLKNARAVLDKALSDKRFPPALKADLHAAAGEYYVREKSWDQAIEELNKAIKAERRRYKVRRYHFIIAQLEQKHGSPRKAIFHYDQAISRNPVYEMLFDAKLNIARLAEAGNADLPSIRADLMRMARDEKNKTYQDVLYYEVGSLDMRLKQLKDAETNFKKSAQYATASPANKGLAFLALSKLYFNTRNYPKAEQYYDSTLAFLAKDHPDYEETANRKKFLTELVTHLTTIALEDSLQRLSRMPDKQLNRLIDRVIEEENLAKDKARFEAEKQANSPTPNPADAPRDPSQGPGMPPGPGGFGAPGLPGSSGKATFYFYNNSLVSMGFSEFLSKWGNRELADNWRRSKREVALQSPTNTSEPNIDSLIEADAASKNLSKTEKALKAQRARYLSKIPKTPEQMKASDDRLANAYYQLGVVYRDKLNEDEEAAQSFETLMQRFPKNKLKGETCYTLVQLFTEAGNKTKADYYRDLLKKDSESARYVDMLDHPEKTQVAASKISPEETALYNEAFRFYTAKNFIQASNRVEQARQKFPKSSLMPKFDLIGAICLGKTKDTTAMRMALEAVIRQYPKDAVANSAQEMLNVLRSPLKKIETTVLSSEVKPKANPTKTDSLPPKPVYLSAEDSIEKAVTALFQPDQDKPLYLALFMSDSVATRVRIAEKMASFNTRQFSLLTFDVEPKLYDPRFQLVVVKEFPNRTKGMEYYNTLMKDPIVFLSVPKGSWDAVLISQDNMRTLMRKYAKDAYLQYFKLKYLSKPN